MLKKKSPVELKKSQIVKTQRTLIRLKHSLAADEEINTTLPNTLDEFDAAIARGEFKDATARIAEALGN